MKQPNSTPTAELMLRETASQTAGPYVHIGLALHVAGLPERDEEIWSRMATSEVEGEPIEVVGTVIDGNGDLVRDALLEAWQADAKGEYRPEFDLEQAFNSFGRTATTAEGGSEWSLATIKPGAVKRSDGKVMAPHINLAIFARGINIHLQTRLYFEDETEANAACPVLNAIESPARRQTLIAKREELDGKVRYRLDIRLQGEGETVFFDF
ncbi:protocatechuate 3,4-dioxygenase subunit alpha [Halomonas urumqiensis]|uniref:Protocatechuate 3,4-dioxygenase subunit alpha n=1 Tax=Halomonas urumqiensis TaxID=1684789 RepID=A0A2N7UJ61_9GAMM|nr:protocatechuate 3,4-dioxygenase subunit alpha [Halomonas urumqiensis]PMR80474.1 protocatechuate 3,4-dioxygenase subunit alpha [Halomonas urumqiensis]PTB01681.1 protocatechuate 3,4-dioxygenase subunit alpha [Halomonas urumqiensis]GHE22228.1 protocatechuate 3,4-dioxygenase subunit alpha [Halomonas urumqiensis]